MGSRVPMCPPGDFECAICAGVGTILVSSSENWPNSMRAKCGTCRGSGCIPALKAEKVSTATLTASGDPKAAAGSAKVPVHLVPPAAIIEMARALDEGANYKDYGAYNWRRGGKLKKSVYLGGALRHIYAMLDGEVLDPESLNGKTHLAGALASLGILADLSAAGNLDDDIPPGVGAELLRKYTKGVK